MIMKSFRSIPMSKRLKIGDKVTMKEGSKEAYYSNYGGNPVILFKAGMVGTVATNDTPVVCGPENAWFYCVDFHSEETGNKERVHLYHFETKKVKE